MLRRVFLFVLVIFSSPTLFAQCTLTNASDCVCLDPNEIDCDLLPDITVEWDYGETLHGVRSRLFLGQKVGNCVWSYPKYWC